MTYRLENHPMYVGHWNILNEEGEAVAHIVSGLDSDLRRAFHTVGGERSNDINIERAMANIVAVLNEEQPEKIGLSRRFQKLIRMTPAVGRSVLTTDDGVYHGQKIVISAGLPASGRAFPLKRDELIVTREVLTLHITNALQVTDDQVQRILDSFTGTDRGRDGKNTPEHLRRQMTTP